MTLSPSMRASAVNRSVTAFVFIAALVLPARADNEPLLWPDGTITYRDWGLYRGGVPILIERPYRYYGGPPVSKNEGTPYYPRGNGEAYPVTHSEPDYYPTNRSDPNAYKMKPPIRQVNPEPYYRSWGTGSDPAPAPASAPQQFNAPVEGPAMIYAPKEGRRRQSKGHSTQHSKGHSS